MTKLTCICSENPGYPCPLIYVVDWPEGKPLPNDQATDEEYRELWLLAATQRATLDLGCEVSDLKGSFSVEFAFEGALETVFDHRD